MNNGDWTFTTTWPLPNPRNVTIAGVLAATHRQIADFTRTPAGRGWQPCAPPEIHIRTGPLRVEVTVLMGRPPTQSLRDANRAYAAGNREESVRTAYRIYQRIKKQRQRARGAA